MNLFQTGFFKLHSGVASNFKVDCDALTDEDINTIALQLVQRLPKFRAVEGVPRGGLRLAEAMQKYTYTAQHDSGLFIEIGWPLLIVDDVYTTGGSMKEYRTGRVDTIGAVIFARAETPEWITPFWRLTP